MQKIWLVKFPTYKYEEDVKELARKNDLRIIDEKHKNSIHQDFVCAKPPKLTLKGKYDNKSKD